MQNQETDILQGVIDAMQDMLRVLDLQQKVLYANSRYTAYFGDQVGNDCRDMYDKKDACKECVSKIALLSGREQEKKIRHQSRVLQVRAAPFYDALGQAVGTVELFRDITEELLQQRRLLEQSRYLEREATFASKMQKDLFMAQGSPDERVVMAARYLPASTLGGDMFGCLRQENGNFCFYVADVSGHGIAAAMITIYLVHSLANVSVGSPVAMLDAAREAFLSFVEDDQLYVSMFVAILNPQTGELRWANAGLNAVPLLVGDDGLKKLYSPALPVCNWEETITYEEHTNYMPENGRLLIYTDGLLDAKSSRLDESELIRRVTRLQGEDLLQSLERQVLKKRGDDVCMLLVTRGANDGAPVGE